MITVHGLAARGIAKAHNLITVQEAIDYLTDDRSHGDEVLANIAARLARENWPGRTPKGNRAAAVKFIRDCSIMSTAIMGYLEGK